MIQPLVLERLPCYDFTPIIEPTFDCALRMVRLQASGVPDSHGVTGGVYKARERIHRSKMCIRDSALSACKHKVSGYLSLPYRGPFHLSLTVLLLYRSSGSI